jgi:hypothetical protein
MNSRAKSPARAAGLFVVQAGNASGYGTLDSVFWPFPQTVQKDEAEREPESCLLFNRSSAGASLAIPLALSGGRLWKSFFCASQFRQLHF